MGRVSQAFPRALSPSRANDFQTCPLLFRLRSIDRIPEAPSAAAVRGTLVHEVLERMFDLPAGGRSIEATKTLVSQAWLRLAAADEPAAHSLLVDAKLDPAAESADHYAAAMVKKIQPLLETYFTLEDPSRLEPHAREVAISVEIAEGFSIRGFIDRVDKAPAGQIRIVDYKTGRAPRAGFESKPMFQMRFYALAWWRLTGEIPAMLQLLYLGSNEALRYEPDEQDLLNTEQKILSIRARIQSAVTEGFVPTPSKLCSWCSYQHLCPSYGGTPPDLPSQDTWESLAFESAQVEES